MNRQCITIRLPVQLVRIPPATARLCDSLPFRCSTIPIGEAVQYAAESSGTTHGAPECLDACRLQAGIICRALSGTSKDAVIFGESASFQGEPKIMAIAHGEYRNKPIGAIHGTGYVVQSLGLRSVASITQTPSRPRF